MSTTFCGCDPEAQLSDGSIGWVCKAHSVPEIAVSPCETPEANGNVEEVPSTSGKCPCGALECWDVDDYSWVSSRSGWHGELHGCQTSVFFIHGKKIREQRHTPEGRWGLDEMLQLLIEWSRGLPDPVFIWDRDTGSGDAGFWIEGVREPNDEDIARLQECRDRRDAEDRRTLERIQRRLAKAE